MLKIYINPRKILLEEFKRLHAQSGILNNLNEKTQQMNGDYRQLKTLNLT